MVSYFKTQWWRLLCALICLALTIMYCVQDNELLAVAWTVSFIFWLLMSNIDYNHQRLEILEAKAEKYDALHKLVEVLMEANDIDIAVEKEQDRRIKRLEDGLYDLRRKLYSDVD